MTILLLLSAFSAASGQSTFEQRAARVKAQYDTTTTPGILSAALRYAERRDIARADSIFLACKEITAPKGDMFWMYIAIGTYLHGKDVMSAEAARAARTVWKSYFPYRGDTENHWCLYYTSLYLAAESWPGLPGTEWYNGRSSDENLRDAREYLIHWIDLTTSIGQGEFDSPTYLPEYVIPMTLLGQFALDPQMKKRGRMMLEYLLADFAEDHLDGMYCGASARDGATAVFNPRSAPASEFAYLYFDGPEVPVSGWTLFPALSDFRVPDLILGIANDRSTPVLAKERKRVRNVIRHGAERNPPVYKTTWMTSEYGLSSLQGGILQPIQQHTWSVRFKGAKPYSTIFGLHPYWSGRELAMFFPEQEKMLVDDVIKSKGTYSKETKWTGSSPYERIYQHRNTLLALYDIPAGTSTGHIDLFFPKTLAERIVDSSGWILCRAGDTYIGVYPLQRGEWMRLGEDESNHRFRSSFGQNGYVVEVRSKNEAGSFEEFRTRCLARTPFFSLREGRVSVTYTSIDGAQLNFAFPEQRFLNGKPVDLTKYKLFDSPFLQSDVNSNLLRITHNSRTRTLNFRMLTISEK
jgi:hypothetical protein